MPTHTWVGEAGADNEVVGVIGGRDMVAATAPGWTPPPATAMRPGKAESCTGTALPHVTGRDLPHKAESSASEYA